MKKIHFWIVGLVFLISVILTGGVLAANGSQDSPPEDFNTPEEVPDSTVNLTDSIDAGIEAVALQYAFASSSGTYTEIVSGTVHGDASNDDTSFNAIDLGFTYHFNNVDYTQISIQSNGFVAMGPSVSSSYTPLSTGSSNNVVAALGRDIEGNDTTSELMSKLEGDAPNRVFTVQWKHYRRYGSTYTGDDFNFQIKLYESSNKVELVYGTFVFHNTTTLFVQVGLRGDTNADFNNRTTATDWTNSTAGTTNVDTMALDPTVFPPSGLTYEWTLLTGVFIDPAAQNGANCKGSDLLFQVTVINATGVDQSFDLSYLYIWPSTGPSSTGVIPNNGMLTIDISVHIPWAVNNGDSDVLTITATGGGFTSNATITSTADLFSGWVDYANAPRPVRAPSVVYHAGKMYKIGGYDGSASAYLDIYDIATDTWTQGADMPGARYWIDCEAIGDYIYCAGGYLTSGQTSLYRYDTLGDTWATLTAMSSYRYSYASAALNGKYYVIGGYGAAYQPTIWEYDPVTDTWNYSLPNMTTGRRYHSAGVIGGKIYVAGGYSPSYLNSVEIFDPTGPSWTAGPSMPTTWLNAADGVIGDRYLILAGGDDNSTGASSNLAWILDTQTNIWSAMPNMAHALYSAEGDGDGTDFWVVTGRLYEGGTYSYSPYTTKVIGCDATCTSISGLDFTWNPTEPWVNFPVTFDANAVGSPPVYYNWTFGDGDTGQGEIVEHTYLAGGTFPVQVTGTNCDGANQATMTHFVDVALPPVISVEPDSLLSIQLPDQVLTQTLEVCNLGEGSLLWAVTEQGAGLSASFAPGGTQSVNAITASPAAPALADSGLSGSTAITSAPDSISRPEGIGDEWEIMAPLPSARVFNAVISAGQFVYVIGGTSDAAGTIPTNTNFRYNPADNTWATMAPMPASLDQIDGIAIGDFIYIPGSDPDSNTYVYDTVADTWSAIPANGGYAAPVQYQVVAIGNNLYVLGGIIGSTSTTSVWILDTSSGTWTAGVPMQKSRTSFSAEAINGNIYVAGGVYYPGFTPDMTAEMFDGFSWSYIASVPDGGGAYTRWSYNADGMAPGALWLGAGRRDAGWAVLNHAGYYDVATDTWTDSPTIPMLNQGRVYTEGTVATDGYFYVIGGRDSAGAIVYDTNERLKVYDVDIPWLDENPKSGTVIGGDCATVDVRFDSTGLDPADYFANLLFTSNDPVTPMTTVPVTLSVTAMVDFVYYDLEDIVLPGEAVYLAGDFTDWITNSIPMDASADNSVFTASVIIPAGIHEYKYIVYTDTVPTGPPHWDWLQSYPPDYPIFDRTVDITGSMTVDDYRDIVPGRYYIESPDTITITVGYTTEAVHGRMYAWGYTEEGEEPRGLMSEIGFGTGIDPSVWTTWSDMTWDSQIGDEADLIGNMTPTEIGVFSYAVRFNANWGVGNPNDQWYYGDAVWDDPTYNPEQAGVLTVLAATADLSVVKTGPSSVKPGDTFIYTLTVENMGPDSATDVVLVDTLPAGVTIVTLPELCTEAAGVVTCDLGASVPSGETIVVEIEVTAPATPGLITNQAEVSSQTPDPDTTNNTDSLDTMVSWFNMYLPFIYK